MPKAQVRIGQIISVFSLVLWVSKISVIVLSCSPIINIISYPNICYPLCSLLFFASSFYEKKSVRIAQCGAIFIMGICALCDYPNSDFFGLAIISISIVLLFAYGFVEKHYLIKCTIIDILLYLLFVFIPLANVTNKYIHSLEWLAFIDIFLFLLWSISRDSIEKLRKTENENREKYMRIIDEATSVARDAIKALDKIKSEEEKKGI